MTIRKLTWVFAGLAVFGLVAGVLVTPSGGSTPSAAQGVTKDAIEIVVIVPDIDALAAKGIVVSGLSTADFTKRFSAYVDAYGPINGRKIVVKPVGWDPIDVTSFDKACTQAVIDNKPFVVINGSGYRQSSVACITVDNKTPYISGDMAYGGLQKVSGKNLLTLGLPAEVAARTAAQMVAKTGVIPKSAKIGILSNNEPGVKAAGDALETELRKRGYNVVEKVELNALAADASLIRRESGIAAGTFQAKGVDTVWNVQSFTTLTGFFEEIARANLRFKIFALDGQANTCTANAAARTPAAAVGTVCITTWDSSRTVPTKDQIKPDNKLEAQCRKEFDAVKGAKSHPGAPSGKTTVNGVTYVEDLSPFECTIANLLLPAIKKAGKNPTWDKVYANLMKTTKVPVAFMSNGEGSLRKNKPYVANQVHMVTLTAAGADTPKGPGETFNGCALPVNCWVPQLINGQQWFPIASGGNAERR